MRSTMLHPTHNNLSSDVRQKMVGLLNQQLADTFDLFSQVKQAHWNVKGPQFISLHKLFDEIAALLAENVDVIAERATSLGGTAQGTARMAAANSRLQEYPLDVFDGMQHVEALVARCATLAASTRAAIEVADEHGDADTADLFTQISREIDKQLWFLEAHIQK